MNFFDAQDKARRATRWLVIVYVLATILIVAGVTAIVGASFYSMDQTGATMQPDLLIGTAILATMLIVGSTLYKTARLSSGGGRVAQDMGGSLVSPDAQDPLRRRLRNVVEEIAIASGVPVPEIYVLEEENGINAFAAGFTPGDAAIAVTRGCLELLDRDELQGVIAHEFSHILNGDMRLNIRMMGVLFGIMVLGIIGRFVLRGSYYGSVWSGRRNKSAPVIMIIGIGLTLLGWIGVFFARLVKAAVSRQREFLADASAVQFTRQTDGIANALKKIGGYSGKSYIKHVDPEEVSHMLFAGGVARLTSMFATHPPLADRITALDPDFKESDYPTVELKSRKMAAEPDSVAGFSQTESSAFAEPGVRSVADTVVDAVGHPESHHILFAQKLRSSIHPKLYNAAHAPDEALLLAIALSLSANEDRADRQLRVIEDQIGAERADIVRQLFKLIVASGPAFRLPLLQIAFPSIKNRPEQQIEFLLNLAVRLIQLDGEIDLSEYCYYRVLSSQLVAASAPALSQTGNRVAKKSARRAAVDLIRIVADQGNDNDIARQHAFEAGVAPFGAWANDLSGPTDDNDTVALLDQGLDELSRLNPAGKQSLLRAVSETISHDGKLTVREAELLRAICASLNCPLPPMLEKSLDSGD